MLISTMEVMLGLEQVWSRFCPMERISYLEKHGPFPEGAAFVMIEAPTRLWAATGVSPQRNNSVCIEYTDGVMYDWLYEIALETAKQELLESGFGGKIILQAQDLLLGLIRRNLEKSKRNRGRAAEVKEKAESATKEAECWRRQAEMLAKETWRVGQRPITE